MASKNISKPKIKFKPINNKILLLILSIFQFVTGTISANSSAKAGPLVLVSMLVLILFEWAYFVIFYTIFRRRNFELEIIAFFLSGVGITILGSIDDGKAVLTQLVAVIFGIIIYTILIFFLEDTKRCMRWRKAIAIISIILLIVNIVIGKMQGAIHGAYNWIDIKGISIQPSEFVKIAFIFCGSATLEKIQSQRNKKLFFIFAAMVMGLLVIIRDFGTLSVFFVGTLLFLYFNYGSFKLVTLASGGAVAGAAGVLAIKPYIRQRFKNVFHIWEPDYIDGYGFQQTRTLIGLASGGLFGVGMGKGYVRNIFAAKSDIVFGVICEEWGFIFGVLIILSFVFIALTAYVNCKTSRSAFYSIGAIVGSAMLLFQCGLNVFGVTNVIPLTGVTLPFISQGGSSIISCWAIIAFIKAADIRTYNNIGGKKKR